MSGITLLSGGGVSSQIREENNRRTHPGVMLAVLGTLLLYGYLFTRLYEYTGLSSPQQVATRIGLYEWLQFEPGEYLVSRVQVTFTSIGNGRERRELLLLGIAAAFISVYLAPVRWKRFFIVGAFYVLLWKLYGWFALIGLTWPHLLAWFVYHPRGPCRALVSATGASLCVLYWTGFDSDGDWFGDLHTVLVSIATGVALTPILLGPVTRRLESSAGRWVRLLVSYAVPLVVWSCCLADGFTEFRWYPTAGLLLFFWQWVRLILYNVDHSDGSIPEDLSVIDYLSTFLSPAVLPCWGWGVIVAQGYTYQDGCFLSRDKNRIAMSGVRLALVALFYFCFGDALFEWILQWIRNAGVPVERSIGNLLEVHLLSGEATPLTVIGSCWMHILRWLFRWAGLFHFLVAIWRWMGYDVAARVNYPFLATNLVTLWARLMYHHREFVVRAYYYPAFLRLTGRSKTTRIVVATLFSAGLANWITGPMVEYGIVGRCRYSSFTDALSKFPFFVLLAGGIVVAEFWLLKKRPRKPGNAFVNALRPTSLAAIALSITYYMAIAIFFYTDVVPEAPFSAYLRLFLRGCGIV